MQFQLDVTSLFYIEGINVSDETTSKEKKLDLRIERLIKKNNRIVTKLVDAEEQRDRLLDRNQELRMKLIESENHAQTGWSNFHKIRSLIPLKFYEIEFISVDSSGQESHVMKRCVSGYCAEMAIESLSHEILGFVFKSIKLTA